jgi:hypothetical protein
MVQNALKTERTTRALRQALKRALRTSDDELTLLVVERCQDLAYAHAFGKALLAAGLGFT